MSNLSPLNRDLRPTLRPLRLDRAAAAIYILFELQRMSCIYRTDINRMSTDE